MQNIKGLSDADKRAIVEIEISQRVAANLLAVRFRECVVQLKKLQEFQKRINDCGLKD